jgi:hypothetical protein
MSNQEILRYSQEFLLYLSSSPLVPKIDLSNPIKTTSKPTNTPTSKKKKSKKEEWVLEEERFTFDSKGTNAIEEFKLMMKSKDLQPPVTDILLPLEESPVQHPTPGGKSRFLKFFDDKPVSESPPVNPPVQPSVVLSQEQQQFQRVMAMLARSSMNPSEPKTPDSLNSHVPNMNGYYSPDPQLIHDGMYYPPAPQPPVLARGHQPPSPASLPSVAPVTAPNYVVESVPVVEKSRNHSRVGKVKASPMICNDSNPLNAMLQSSIKAKRFTSNDAILQQFQLKK